MVPIYVQNHEASIWTCSSSRYGLSNQSFQIKPTKSYPTDVRRAAEPSQALAAMLGPQTDLSGRYGGAMENPGLPRPDVPCKWLQASSPAAQRLWGTGLDPQDLWC